jgi:enoyl-[acyl-carrier protein] reductase I
MEKRGVISLDGKTACVLGVADRESLAWSIARAYRRAGAKVIIGYQKKFLSRVRALLDEEPKDGQRIEARRCDVLDPDELAEFFRGVKADVLVHSVAYGPESAFTENPSDVSARDFGETLEISAHSLAKVVRFAKPSLNPGASVITLSFQAAERAMPMYGMMGVAKAALESLVRYLAVELGPGRVRVNAISAGPIETLAALAEIVAFKRKPEALERLRGALVRQAVAEQLARAGGGRGGAEPEFEDEIAFARSCWRRVQEEFAARSAIPDTLTADDIADSALFLASDASRKITGQILHVDCGYSSCLLL